MSSSIDRAQRQLPLIVRWDNQRDWSADRLTESVQIRSDHDHDHAHDLLTDTSARCAHELRTRARTFDAYRRSTDILQTRLEHALCSQVEFDDQVRRDRPKDALCHRMGVMLVRIPFTVPLNQYETFIRQQLREAGFRGTT
jgi:hypothetical protein